MISLFSQYNVYKVPFYIMMYVYIMMQHQLHQAT